MVPTLFNRVIPEIFWDLKTIECQLALRTEIMNTTHELQISRIKRRFAARIAKPIEFIISGSEILIKDGQFF